MHPENTLILVDDCRIEAMFIEDAVAASESFCGFEHVADSREAVSRITSRRPNAVLLDLRMPGLSGWEVLDGIREAGLLENTKVAVLSNSDAKSDQQEAARRGACAYFVKPKQFDGYHQILDEFQELL